MRFLAVLLSLVCSIGLILHILIDENDAQVLMVNQYFGKVQVQV